MIERASEFEFLPGIKLITCSAEDLIILKAFANRPQDWVDIENIIEKQKESLSVSYVKEYLVLLCKVKNTPEIVSRFDVLCKKYINIR